MSVSCGRKGKVTSDRTRERSMSSEGRENLTPVDTDTSRTRGGDAETTLSLTLEPSQGPLVISQVRFELFQASAVVILHPLFLVLGKHTILNHLGLNGDTSKALEAEPAVAVELVFGLDSPHDESGFDADTKFSGNI
jgi:hypothetical protein